MDVDALRCDGETTIVLLRHGRTAWNAEKRFLGRTDIGLDEVGHAEAVVLSGAIRGRFDRVYTSPLSRAAETAAYLAPPDPVPVDGLQELSQGELEGLVGEVAVARYASFFAEWVRDPETARVPGGETMGECRDRSVAALGEIVEREGPGRVIAVVSHQMVMANLACTFAGRSLADWRDHRVGNTGGIVARWGPDGWRIIEMGWNPSAAKSA